MERYDPLRSIQPFPIPEFFPFPDDITVLCGALGLSEIELSKKAKPQITRDGYCFVPVRDNDSLQSLDPNMELLKKMYEHHQITAFAVVTTDTGEQDLDWHMRFFAPALGVNEDPVTGSANGPMAALLPAAPTDLLDQEKKNTSPLFSLPSPRVNPGLAGPGLRLPVKYDRLERPCS